MTEYLEVDLPARSICLLAQQVGEWIPIDRSAVLDLTVDDVLALLPDE